MSSELYDLRKLSKNPLMLCNVMYQRGTMMSNYEDFLNIIYKDMITNEKKLLTIPSPVTEFYEVPEEMRCEFKRARHHLPKDKLIRHTCKYRDVQFEIAKIMGPEYVTLMKQLKGYEGRREKKKVFKYPYTLGADIDIDTVYRSRWKIQCGNDKPKKISKIYIDSEIDQSKWVGPMAENGEVPINAITAVDEESMTAYAFLLDQKDNPQISPFKERLDEFIQECHNSFDESYGEFKYEIYFFDEEIEMITQFFNLLHTLKRDVCLIWNMRFDAKYFIARIKELGYEPRDIICHPDFPVQTLFYYEDMNPKNFDFDKRGDYFDVSGYTQFIDQTKVYACLRKSQGAVKSVSLGTVAQNEIGDDKLDYGEVANIRTFAYDDFWTFTLYSLKDVFLQYGIERKTGDIDMVYLTSYINCVSLNGTMKQTICIRGFMYDGLGDLGEILGNNINYDNTQTLTEEFFVDDGDDSEFDLVEISEEEAKKKKFKGAINADPELNANVGLPILSFKSKYLFGHSIDLDFSSLYPNIILAFNIFASTMIGKLIIKMADSGIKLAQKSENEDKDAGREFIEDYLTGDKLHIGRKWFGLPSYRTVSKILKDKLGRK